MYIIIRCLNSYLPWYNTVTDSKDIHVSFLKIKEQFWGDKLCEGLSPVFQEFVSIITNMQPEDDPPYDLLIDLMMTVVDEKGYKKKLTEEDLTHIAWNKHISRGKFGSREVNQLRDLVPRFVHDNTIVLPEAD